MAPSVSISLSILRRSTGSRLEKLTKQYINGMTTKPSKEHITLIDDFVKNNKDIITKADVLYLGNINNSNDSFRNLAKDVHHGTMHGTGLVWNSYWGFSNPSGTGYVDTNYNPSTQGINLTQNNAGLGIYHHTNVASSSVWSIGVYATNYLGLRLNTDSFAVNQEAVVNISSVPFRAGLFGAFRTLSNAVNSKNQNLTNTTGTNTSTAIPNGNIHLFNCNGLTAYYLGGLNFTYIGSSLTDDEYTQLNNAVNDYLIQCLFLKYGADNWGVKMAKSYFLELHNFEKYEAFEVYEFINRHQSDYVDSAGTGYLYSTFGPNGQNKTVADYIMLFKAGGNLGANTWIKTGATLRWNQDGSITNSNTMPAYTRGSNLGIVTVTSTDGWNGLTQMSISQTSSSLNSFYGNLPLVSKIKTLGKYYFAGVQNRYKYISMPLDNTILSGIQIYSITPPGYNKNNISHYIGGSYSNFYLNRFYNPATEITGDFSAFTNEVTGTQFYVRGYDEANKISTYGTLNNFIPTNFIIVINMDWSDLTGGLSNHNKNITTISFVGCKFSTQAVDSQLAVINNYFATVTPINNVAINLGGATMGIPTGGANNTDLLGIIAKHVAAGFTATIIVRTV